MIKAIISQTTRISVVSTRTTSAPAAAQSAPGTGWSFGPAVVTTMSAAAETPPRLLDKTSKDPVIDAQQWKTHIESMMNGFVGASGIAWSGSDDGLAYTKNGFLKCSDAGSEKWQKKLASALDVRRSSAAASEDALKRARQSFEELGFKVEGTVYEIGANGRWQPGNFKLTGEGHGFTISYDGASGQTSITYHDDPTAADAPQAPASPAEQQAQSLAADKAAVADDIFAQAAEQAEQYNGLIRMMDASLERLRQAGRDEAAQQQVTDIKAKIEQFQVDDWDQLLKDAGFTPMDGQPLILLGIDGTLQVNRGPLEGLFDGVHVHTGIGPTQDTYFLAEGMTEWRKLSAEQPDPVPPAQVDVTA
jgi:hypothetical protein